VRHALCLDDHIWRYTAITTTITTTRRKAALASRLWLVREPSDWRRFEEPASGMRDGEALRQQAGSKRPVAHMAQAIDQPDELIAPERTNLHRDPPLHSRYRKRTRHDYQEVLSCGLASSGGGAAERSGLAACRQRSQRTAKWQSGEMLRFARPSTLVRIEPSPPYILFSDRGSARAGHEGLPDRRASVDSSPGWAMPLGI
jgi:hypothetical protein